MNKMKKTVLVSAIVSAILAISAGAFNIKKQEKKAITFQNVLETSSNKTYLDEYLESKKSKLIDEVTLLEEYIELSNKLDKKNYGKIYITKEQIEEGSLLKPYEIENLLANYKKSKTEENLFQINLQKKLINKYIMDNGYRISSELTLITTKIKLAESYGFNKDLTFKILEEITIPSQEEHEKGDQFSIKIGNNTVILSGDLKTLINKTHKLQHFTGEEIEEEYKERNETIQNSIDYIEKVLPKTHKLKIK